MPPAAYAAVTSFIAGLPASIAHVELADVHWLVDQLRDADFAHTLSTKQASAAARALGSSTLMRSYEFCARLADALAVYFEQDTLVQGDLQEKELATWVASLQHAALDDTSEHQRPRDALSCLLCLALLFPLHPSS